MVLSCFRLEWLVDVIGRVGTSEDGSTDDDADARGFSSVGDEGHSQAGLGTASQMRPSPGAL